MLPLSKLKSKALPLIAQGLPSAEIALKLDVHPSVIRQLGGRTHIREPEAQRAYAKKYVLNDQIFRVPLTDATAWALGLIVGDGCIIRHKGILRGVSILGDLDVCEKVRVIMAGNAPIRKIPGTHDLRFNNGPLAKSLVECWGITPDKSRTVPFPNITAPLIPNFVRGLWDSDGCVYALKIAGRSYPAVSFCSYSRVLIDRVASIAREVTGSRVQPSAAGEGWIFGLANQKARTFADWLWKESTSEIRGDRKYKLFYELASKPTAREINRKKWDEVRKEAMILFEQGKSPQEISDQLGLSGPQIVNQWLRQAGVIRTRDEIEEKRLASRKARRFAKLATKSSSVAASISSTS